MSEKIQRLAGDVREQGGLPEVHRPFNARPIFLIVGMHGSGASMIAQMLQLLGVDMAEGAPSNDNEHLSTRWERPEIVAFNNRLLETIGRPLGSATHALPFAAGWWADPRVRTIKREIQDYLRAALEPSSTFWGFKDLRVTRLLPLWQQVFDDLGLRPIYLWTVRDPSEPIGMADKLGASLSPSMSEVMWLIYNSEVCKYVGSEAAAVVDYQRWFQGPETIVQMLLGRLPLSWRGSQADLLECVRMIAPVDTRHAHQPRMNSPLVRSLYESILTAEDEDDTERFQASIVQAVDIVRSLVVPYASLVADRSTTQRIERQEQAETFSSPGEDLTAKLAELTAHANELESLLERTTRPVSDKVEGGASEIVCRLEQQISDLENDLSAARSRADAAEAATAEIEQTLSGELQTQVAQNDWLRKNNEVQQSELRATVERLLKEAEVQKERLHMLEIALDGKSRDLQLATAALESTERTYREEIALLSIEIKKCKDESLLQKSANEKYLARIYELKAHAQSGKPKS